jgi:phosphomevalonate kinase
VRAIAPGKVLLTGAYAVLEGAPAIVAAVDRYAIADGARTAASPSPEVVAWLGDQPAPEVDVSALHDVSGRKLGLGSSAAALVASVGVRALARGDDLGSPAVKDRIFRVARDAHARAQAGGSGADVAASVYGGVIRYAIGSNAGVLPLELPAGLFVAVYDSGTSVRTSDMLARVHALRAGGSSPRTFADLCEVATEAAGRVGHGDARGFVESACAFGRALAALGLAALAPIVPPRFAELASRAEREDAAFVPSGAGGGDVAVWLGLAPPSAAFASRADALAMRPLALGIDCGGLRPESPARAGRLAPETSLP